MDPFPDFFLVGAPRCGTTALSKYLKSHPRICFSRPKETHYFTQLYFQAQVADVRRDYVERFFGHYSPDLHQAMGEGSVTYLYSPESIKKILELQPGAKFIVMVRNPLEMIPSFHSLMYFYGQEEVAELAEAWALQGERAAGRRLPRRCLDARLLQYAEVGKLGNWVEALHRIAGAEQCHVIVHDDFERDPRAVYVEALRFLGVEDDGRTDFPRKKANRSVKRRWLQRLLYWHPASADRLVAFVHARRKKRTSPLIRLHKRLIRANVRESPPPPLDPGLRETLRREFAESNARLGELLGRDLSHWR